MPEPLPSAAQDLAGDEEYEGLPVDAGTQQIAALAIVAASSASVTTNTGSHIGNVTIALAIVSVPILGRITRASALSWSEREFVLAARAQGASHFRIMVRELLPNV